MSREQGPGSKFAVPGTTVTVPLCYRFSPTAAATDAKSRLTFSANAVNNQYPRSITVYNSAATTTHGVWVMFNTTRKTLGVNATRRLGTTTSAAITITYYGDFGRTVGNAIAAKVELRTTPLLALSAALSGTTFVVRLATGTGVAATETVLSGTSGAMTLTAKLANSTGNNIKYVADTAGTTGESTLVITTTGTLATTLLIGVVYGAASAGTTNTTAAGLAAAINAHATASLYVTAVGAGSAAITSAVTTASLSGGVNPVTKSTPVQVATVLEALASFAAKPCSCTATASTTTKTLGAVASGNLTGGVDKESATARATAMTVAKALNTTAETAVFWVPNASRRDFTLGEDLLDLKVTAATAGQAAVFIEVAYEPER